MKKKDETIEGQMTLLDLVDSSGEIARKFSSGAIESMIAELMKAKSQALEREREENRRKKEEERRRKEEEKRRKKEEHVLEVTSMDLPLDWNNVFDADKRTSGVHADSAADALVICLNTLGTVDIEYISSITGKPYKEVICALKGSIYQNPDTWNECFYKGWETSEEYLSGNLMRKWKSAKKADKDYNGYFSDNVKALEKVLPPAVATEDIYVTLGSPWIPTDVIDDFILHLFGECRVWEDSFWAREHWHEGKLQDTMRTRHDDITGTWELPNKARYNHSIAVSQTYGTKRMEALHIIERTLNMKTVAVYDEVSCANNGSGKKRVINKHKRL